MKKISNTRSFGIYTDHQRACIVAIDPEGNTITTEIRNIYLLPARFAGEATTKTGMLGTILSRQRKQQQKSNNDFRKFCKQVIDAVKQADQLLLFGPSDAKYELHKVMEEKPALAHHHCVIKTTDKMNAAAATQYVKAFYQPSGTRFPV